jgi:hypothetical protein
MGVGSKFGGVDGDGIAIVLRSGNHALAEMGWGNCGFSLGGMGGGNGGSC